ASPAPVTTIATGSSGTTNATRISRSALPDASEDHRCARETKPRKRNEAMATKLPATDVFTIGLGWTGSMVAKSMTNAGLIVVSIERGPWRDTATDFPPSYSPDELRYAVKHDLFVRPTQTTITFRNKPGQTALPMRELGAFLLPNGVGGAGLHWNSQTWRFLPSDFVLKTHLTQRYGAKFLPEDMTIQDWGVTYDELEPHFDTFEYLCGT